MAKQVKKWITINGNHIPVYEDGSLGGIGANLQQKKDDEWEDYDEQDKLEAIAERYTGSKPVSGNWDTEVEHEQAAIAEELGISKEEAKQLMKDKLGFTDDQFDDAETKASRVEIYKRQLEDVQDQLDSAPKSKALRDEKAIAELEKKKAELESYIERDEEMPFQSKGLSKEEKAEDWAKETQKDIAAKKTNIKEMGYAEAGQFISDHKEEFGLSDDDDAYQIAAQIKNGDIKLDKDGKVSKADRDKVTEGLKAMDEAAKERGDYIEDEPVKGKKQVGVSNKPDYNKSAKQLMQDMKEMGSSGKYKTQQELEDAYADYLSNMPTSKRNQIAGLTHTGGRGADRVVAMASNMAGNYGRHLENPERSWSDITAHNVDQKKKVESNIQKQKSIKIGDKQVGVSKDPHAAERAASIAKMKADEEDHVKELKAALKQHPNDANTSYIKDRLAKAQERLKRLSKGDMSDPATDKYFKTAAEWDQEKSINVGGKKVGVNKGKTPSIRDIVGSNGEYQIGKAYTKSNMMEIAEMAGIPRSQTRKMTVAELRKMMLAMWRKG